MISWTKLLMREPQSSRCEISQTASYVKAACKSPDIFPRRTELIAALIFVLRSDRALPAK